MSEILTNLAAGAAGAALGALYFVGLWWTVRLALPSKLPALWFLVSLVGRTALVLGGFYWLGAGHWERLAAALAGFVVARISVTFATRPTPEANRAP